MYFIAQYLSLKKKVGLSKGVILFSFFLSFFLFFLSFPHKQCNKFGANSDALFFFARHLFGTCIHPLQYTCHSLLRSVSSQQFYKAFLIWEIILTHICLSICAIYIFLKYLYCKCRFLPTSLRSCKDIDPKERLFIVQSFVFF